MSAAPITEANPVNPPPQESPALPVSAEELRRLVTEVAGLLEGEPNPQVFFPAFVEKILQVTGGLGVAIWQRDSRGQLRLLHDRDLAILNLDKTPNGKTCHALLLEDASVHARTYWIPPQQDAEGKLGKANFSSWALLLSPILVEKKVVGLLEIICPPHQDRQVKKLLARLSTELAGLAAAFFHKSHWQQLQQQQSLWQELEEFASRVHTGLVPTEIAYLIANDGKKLLGCDQVSVGLRYGKSCRIAAVSGTNAVEKRSPLIKAMRQFLDQVCAWGETVTFEGTRDESLPPGVVQTLDAYLAQSHSLRLVATPLIHKDKVWGVLLAESYDAAQSLNRLPEKIQSLKRHVAPAVANALVHERMPLKWLSAPLAQARDSFLERPFGRPLFYAALVLLAMGLLTFIQLPLRSEATGRLVPRDRRIVYSHLNGKVVQLVAHHGDRVEKGQELLFVEDLETQLKVDQLLVKMNSLNQKLAFLDDQLGKNLALRERSDLLADRLKIQFELHKAKLERSLLISEYRNPRKAPILAPLSGQILTFDAREKLLGKNVKMGDPLLRLAQVEGAWEIEVFIPERQVGRIRAALHRSPTNQLEVDLLLTNDPNRTFRGQLSLDALGGETQIQDSKVVLPASVTINDQALISLLERMPVGVEVHARIRCGHASAGHVWFSELWDFLYERFLF